MRIRVNAFLNVLQRPPVVLTDVTPSVTKNLTFFGVSGVFDVAVLMFAARTSRNRIKRACAHVRLSCKCCCLLRFRGKRHEAVANLQVSHLLPRHPIALTR